MSEVHRPGIAILASGSGSTAEAFIEATQEGIVDAEVGLVISDKEDAGVFERVDNLNRRFGLDIRTEVINSRRFPGGRQERGQTLEEAAVICRTISHAGCALVGLMGYMRIIAAQGDLMQEYGWLPHYAEKDPWQGRYLARLINTHPGILPATADTYGIRTQEKVLAMRLDRTAHTVHAVSAGVDSGPVIAEHAVPAYPGLDTPKKLFDRVQRVEKAQLPIDIDNFLKEQRTYQELAP